MLTDEQFDVWISALRSGKYNKGTRYLRSDDGYCCLGVLADTLGVKWRLSGGGRFCSMTQEIAIGETSLRNSIVKTKVQDILADLNDRTELNFVSIAHHLRALKPLIVG